MSGDSHKENDIANKRRTVPQNNVHIIACQEQRFQNFHEICGRKDTADSPDDGRDASQIKQEAGKDDGGQKADDKSYLAGKELASR